MSLSTALIYLNHTKHNDFGQDLQELLRVVNKVVIPEEWPENLTMSGSRARSIQIFIVLPSFSSVDCEKDSKMIMWTEK